MVSGCNDTCLSLVSYRMKRKFCFAFVAVILAACNKEAESTFQKDVLGTWELERISSWYLPVLTPPSVRGKLVLNADGTYRMERNDSLTNAGTFSIEYTDDCAGQKQHFFRADRFISHTVSLENGKLILGTSNCLMDGGFSVYRKKAE